MRLRILNFAKVKEADIILDGITIIAGKNNTGKSTIGKDEKCQNITIAEHCIADCELCRNFYAYIICTYRRDCGKGI